jgi:Domain of unknown function (DUF4381)
MRHVCHRATLVALLTLAGVAPLPAQQRGRGNADIPVRAGSVVEPETVRVGDPFIIRVRIAAPAGSEIIFPDAPDSTSTVQALDPVRVDSVNSAGGAERTATFRVAAWDVDSQTVRLGDVIVRSGKAERRVALTGISVFVQSVLPADSAKRVPKPARAIYEFGQPMWWLWALIAAAIVALLLGIWWWRRRRRRPKLVAPLDPYKYAEDEFARIEALGLVEAGERGRFVALMAEVLRDYMAYRYTAAPLSLTSTELLEALHGQRAVPQERLRRVLDEVDLVKFARRPLSADRARDLGREARAIVAHEHSASRPAPEAAA